MVSVVVRGETEYYNHNKLSVCLLSGGHKRNIGHTVTCTRVQRDGENSHTHSETLTQQYNCTVHKLYLGYASKSLKLGDTNKEPMMTQLISLR